MKGVLISSVLIVILGLFIYSRTKIFRIRRARKLNDSLEFKALINMGFKSQIVESLKVFIGKYKNHDFLVFIDPSDYYFNNDFSIVFVTSYSEINNDTFKHLNNKYYNRIKSLLFTMEYVFFDKEFAQFRYTNSPLRIKTNRIINKLEKITEIIRTENLKPTEFDDIKDCLKKNY